MLFLLHPGRESRSPTVWGWPGVEELPLRFVDSCLPKPRSGQRNMNSDKEETVYEGGKTALRVARVGEIERPSNTHARHTEPLAH